MRKVLLGLGIGVLCLPMLFVGWLVLASRWAKMDGSTMQAPMAMRQTVAALVLQKATFGKAGVPMVDRVLRLDPENAGAWQRRCSLYEWNDGTPSVTDCQKAVELKKESYNYYNLGRAQDATNDPCSAEESYTEAVSATASQPDYEYVRSMGKSALWCGHLPAAKAGLELAVELEGKALNDPDQDDDETANIKKDRLADQESLVVAYRRGGEETLTGQMCTAAHPGWKGCSCDLDAKGKVACSEVKR
jgi:tetratricopeptide (TPR) repeat protein